MTRLLRCGWIPVALAVCGACGADRQGPTGPTTDAATTPPLAAVDALTGDYTMTVDIGSGCNRIPASDRRRTYDATITSPREAHYIVTLTSGTFLDGPICANGTGLGCNQFTAERTEGLLRFTLANNNDDGFGGHVVEQVSSGAWMEIMGTATGTAGDSVVEAAGTSRIYYCPVQPPGTPCCVNPTGPGNACQTLSFTCESDDMTLKLTRP